MSLIILINQNYILNFLPDKKTTVILSKLLKDTVIIIWTCQHKPNGEHCLGTSRMSIVMFAGKSAKC